MRRPNLKKLECRLRAAWSCLSDWESDPGRAQFQLSFSQNGEDVILWRLFNRLKILNPYYVDIGAHHPTRMSNTRLFYFMGSHGINVEPNPECFRLFPGHRKRDLNLNVGIAPQDGTLTFYIMTDPLLSTFNEEEANRLIHENSAELRSTLQLPVHPLGWLLAQTTSSVDLLSLDTEGMDLAILQSLEPGQESPKVICVESLNFSTTGTNAKLKEIEPLMATKGYTLYADTWINSIYLRSDLSSK